MTSQNCWSSAVSGPSSSWRAGKSWRCKPWKIVVYHDATYNLRADRSGTLTKVHFGPVIDKHHVDVVFNGHEHALARVDRVDVDLDRIGPVLEAERLAQRLRRQLARLADRAEPRAEAVGHRTAENEPPALDAHDDVDARPGKRRREALDGGPEPFRVAKQRRDVVEENARLREIRDVPDAALEELCWRSLL